MLVTPAYMDCADTVSFLKGEEDKYVRHKSRIVGSRIEKEAPQGSANGRERPPVRPRSLLMRHRKPLMDQWIGQLSRDRSQGHRADRWGQSTTKRPARRGYGRILDRLDASVRAADMGLPGYGLHPLTDPLRAAWAVSVSGNWRVAFRFEGQDAVDVNYLDYH